MSRYLFRLTWLMGVLFSGPVFAQSTVLSFKLDDSDLAYTRNPGYTYEITSITVTDASAFRIDGFDVTSTGVAVQRLEYALFEAGFVIPTGLRDFNRHLRLPETVAGRRDGNPNNRGPRALTDRANPAPLTEAEYQLLVAAQDRTGTRGDVSFSLELTGGFFGTVILAPPPTMGSFAAATSGAAFLATNTAQGVARNQAAASFDTRASQLTFARGTDPANGLQVTASTQDRPGLTENLFLWAELTGFRADDDSTGRDFSGAGLQIGGDVALNSNWLLGVSVGYDDISSSTGTTSIDGDLLFIQPYLAYRSGPISAELTLIYGEGDYDQTDLGGTGTGETELAAITFSFGHDFAIAPGRLLTPTLELAYGEEEATGLTGTLAGAGSETVDFTQVSLGARYTHEVEGGAVFAGLYADWRDMDAETLLVADALLDDGLSARFEVGAGMDIGRGRRLETALELGGIGSDVTAINATLRAEIRF